jgi:acid phosphatase type 7
MKKNKKLFILLVTVLITVFTNSCNKSNKIEIKHPRVIWTQNPSNHAIVSWTTMQESANNYIYYDTISRNSDLKQYSYNSKSVRSGKITMKPMDYTEGVPEGYYHHTEIDSLLPDTKYYFVLSSDGNTSNEYYFITAPDNDKTIQLLAGGDSRLGTEKPRYAGRTPHLERQKLKSLIGQLVENTPSIYAFVHGADYGTTADWRHLYWYFEDLQLSITKDGRILPLLISMGNHDTEIGFFENFYLGDDINETAFSYYYTTRFNQNLSLITLNTEISIGGVQYHWLEKELPEVRKNSDWLLINYHKPAYPAVKDTNDFKFARVRQYWVPLFEKNKVDLVIESDGHCLKRTLPILNNKLDSAGIVYIGEGGLGAPLREPDTTRWFLKGGYSSKEYHVWLISVDQNKIDLNAIDINGCKIDSYSITKK